MSTHVNDTLFGIPAGSTFLTAALHRPPAPVALIVFATAGAHDSWQTRQTAARRLLELRGNATLDVNLLTATEEERDRRAGRYHLDIAFLADRLCLILTWVRHQPDLRALPLGLFVGGTASAAALRSASHHADQVGAIVSSCGRADLAEDDLAQLKVPTLLLAVAGDTHVVDLNRQASAMIRAPHRLEVIESAAHVLDDVSTDALVAERSAEWFAASLRL